MTTGFLTGLLTIVNGQVVLRSTTYTWRWYDAWGPLVTKWDLNPHTFPLVYSLAEVAGYLISDTPGTIDFVTTESGGGVVLTVGAQDTKGVTLRPRGQAFYLNGSKPAYFGINFKVSDATQSYVLVGLKEPSADTIADPGDGLYFRSVDASTALTFNTANGASISSTNVATLVDNTAITAEFYYDGTTITTYINNVEAMSTAATIPSHPSTTYLAPHISFLAGEVASKTMTVYWARAMQVRQITVEESVVGGVP